MRRDLISILMPIGNCDIQILKKSLDSINNQTYENIEIVIVCDTTNLDVIHSIKNFAILTKFETKIIYNDNNIGITKSLNKSIKFSKGKFLARFDSDDFMSVDRLEMQYKYLIKNKDIDIVFCNFKKFFFFKSFNLKNHISNNKNILRWRMIFSNQFCHPTVMFRRKLIKKVYSYNEKYIVSQDYDLWTRIIISNTKFYIINKFLYFLRIHKKSVSISKRKIQNLNSINIGYKYLKLNFGKNLKLSKKNYEYLIYILNQHAYDYEKYKLNATQRIYQIKKLYFEILKLSNMNINSFDVRNFIIKDMNTVIYFIGIKRSIGLGIFKYFKINLYILFFLKSYLRKIF